MKYRFSLIFSGYTETRAGIRFSIKFPVSAPLIVVSKKSNTTYSYFKYGCFYNSYLLNLCYGYCRFESKHKLTDFNYFPTFQEIETYLLDIAKNNPNFVKLSQEGKTHEGRALYLLEIGQKNTNNRKTSTNDIKLKN